MTKIYKLLNKNNKNMQIIQKRAIWLSISSVAVVFSIIATLTWGLKLGIDFTGGSLLEVKFTGDRPSVSEVMEIVKDIDSVQPVNNDKMIIRFQDISEEKHQEVLVKLNEMVNSVDVSIDKANTKEKIKNQNNNSEVKDEEKTEDKLEAEEGSTLETLINNEATAVASISKVEELRFDAVGPTIGRELKTKSINALVAVLIAIVLYIAWVFRKVSKPISSWKYGITAIIALFHDVMIVVGIFSFLGYKYGIEINTPFIAALLTVLGYSVNDTIVVFDRVRENLPKSPNNFETTVNTSVNQTIRRSINTSLTTLVVLGSVLLFGGDTIKTFILALSIGVFIGTYSSIFLASPVLVMWERIKNK